MTYKVIKSKGEELFYNFDEIRGRMMFPTPMLMDESKAQSIFNNLSEILHYDEPRVFTKQDLEICEVNVTLS